MFGVVVLHLTRMLTAALGYVIVEVKNGLAYVAHAYPFPDDDGASMTRPRAMSASMRVMTSSPVGE